MVLHRRSIKPIPSLTKEIAHEAFPKGNLYMTLRDELGTFYGCVAKTEIEQKKSRRRKRFRQLIRRFD